MLIYFVSAKILSLHQKSNHIFSRIIIIGIFFPNTTTPLRRLHITTPTTAPNARTFFNPYFPLKSLIKLDLPENSVQTEQEALPESSRYSQFMYRHPFQSTSEKGLTCRLPTEEANSLKQIDRNLAQILPKSHNLFSEKKKNKGKKQKKNPPKSVSLQSILQSIHKHLSHADTTCFNWQETFPPALAFGR